MSKFILLLLAAALLGSCVSTKKTGLVRLSKKSEIYKFESSAAGPTSEVYKINVPKKSLATIKEPSGKGAYEINFVKNSPTKGTKYDHGAFSSVANGKFFFPYDQRKNGSTKSYYWGTAIPSNEDYISGSKLKYWEQSPVFQAVSIPFKIRPSKGDLPYQVTTGFNAGFAYGWKFNFVNARTSYLVESGPKLTKLKYVKRQYSLTPAFFLGPTVIELNASNTENVVTESRKVIGYNLGGFLVTGINNFNLGIGLGLDYATGENSGDWIYKGEPWWGVVIGLDFVK